MPTNKSSEHRTSYRTQVDQDDAAQTEHALDDKLEHKSQHRLEANGDGKSAEFMHKFNTELRGIDDRAAAVFDPKGNIAEHSPDDRRAFVDAYLTAFNNTAPEDLSARFDASRETANMLFRPLYQEVEINEAQSQLNFSAETRKLLDDNDIKVLNYITNTKGEDGNPVDYEDIREIEFSVDTIEQARKIIEESGGTAYTVTTTTLDHHKEEFAALLYGSTQDDGMSANYMDKTLTSAIAYTKMENLEPAEPSDFSMLETHQDEAVLYEVVRQDLKTQGHKVRGALDSLSYANHADAAGAQTASEAFFDTYQEALMMTVANGDQEAFSNISKKFNEFNESFSQAIQHDEGFVKAEEYTQPELQESFNTPDQALNYISEVQDAMASLDHLKGDISSEMYYTLEKMTSEFRGELEFVRQMQDSPQPPDSQEDYNLLHRMAKGINFLMKPFKANRETEQENEPELAPNPMPSAA